jgi:hypothetical protein
VLLDLQDPPSPLEMEWNNGGALFKTESINSADEQVAKAR